MGLSVLQVFSVAWFLFWGIERLPQYNSSRESFCVFCCVVLFFDLEDCENVFKVGAVTGCFADDGFLLVWDYCCFSL